MFSIKDGEETEAVPTLSARIEEKQKRIDSRVSRLILVRKKKDIFLQTLHFPSSKYHLNKIIKVLKDVKV